MFHSVTFGERNTWEDWGLIAVTQPTVSPPETKTKYIDIPGADGSLDLTEILASRPLYKRRKGSMSFVSYNPTSSVQTIASAIMDYLHGKEMTMSLEDDWAYVYTGRFELNAYKMKRHWGTIVIDYDVQPYKVMKQSTTEEWLWDPFNFEDGYIMSGFFANLSVSGSRTVTYQASATTGTGDTIPFLGRQPVIPTIYASAAMTVTFYNPELSISTTQDLSAGNNTLPEIVVSGINADNYVTFEFSGTGTVSIDMKMGRL